MKNNSAKQIPIILDTDMSPDSWAAVLFLAKHPQVDLLAVSISGTGEAHGEIGACNAARLLSLCEKKHVRIGFGDSRPLLGSKHFPGLMRVVMDRLLFIKIQQPESFPKFENSVQMIASILNEYPQPVTIAAVGPQTNMASVLNQHPELKRKIRNVTIMGGAIDVPGNIRSVAPWIRNEVAEWNFFCDPQAVKIVFESEVPVRLVSLDTTNQVPVTQSFLEKYSHRAKSQPALFVLEMIRRIIGNFRRNVGYYLWDPMTCATAVDPGLCEFDVIKLDIITKSGKKWAALEKTSGGSKIQVAKKIAKAKFEKTFIEILCEN